MDRDPKGLFLPGHKIKSPGRPKRSVEDRVLRALRAACSYQDWAAAFKAIMDKAKDGDVQAFKLLLSYAVGSPLQRVQTEVVETVEVSEEYRHMAERVFGVDDDDD